MDKNNCQSIANQLQVNSKSIANLDDLNKSINNEKIFKIIYIQFQKYMEE